MIILWHYQNWNAFIFFSILFGVSFVIDMLTEKKKNKKLETPGQ